MNHRDYSDLNDKDLIAFEAKMSECGYNMPGTGFLRGDIIRLAQELAERLSRRLSTQGSVAKPEERLQSEGDMVRESPVEGLVEIDAMLASREVGESLVFSGSDKAFLLQVRTALSTQAAELERLRGFLTDPELLAKRFHDEYERLAPAFGYETRNESRKWDDAPERQKKLMIATAEAIARAALGGKE